MRRTSSVCSLATLLFAICWTRLGLAGAAATFLHTAVAGGSDPWPAGLSASVAAGGRSSSTLMSQQQHQATCVDIPENLTLCRGISYTQMRLPNLLEHDTMAEVSQQATSWVPLLNLKCHPDTQLFLCSLFSPVCLDRLIYPCRSLCEAVRNGCEGRMKIYGFPWPDMVKCDKFPEDNDMCIAVQSTGMTDSASCQVCQQPETYENIIDNFCRADFVLKTRVKRLKKGQLKCKKAKLLRLRAGLPKKDFRRPVFQHSNLTACCGSVVRSALSGGKRNQPGGNNGNGGGRLLVMGVKHNDGLVPTFIMEWGKTPDFRKALKFMRKVDCSNPKLLSETMLADHHYQQQHHHHHHQPSSARSRKKP